MTLSNFIINQDGDLINTAHIVRIHADFINNGIDNTYYRVMATLDIQQAGRQVEWPLIAFDELEVRAIYPAELAAKYCANLYMKVTAALETITDYQVFRENFDNEFSVLLPSEEERA